jgi:hypothetical protein
LKTSSNYFVLILPTLSLGMDLQFLEKGTVAGARRVFGEQVLSLPGCGLF